MTNPQPCSNCGTTVSVQSRYCPVCGTAVATGPRRGLNSLGVRWAVAAAVVLVLILVPIIWLLTGIYQVGPGENATLRLFGVVQRNPVTQVGLHWWWPGPVGKKDVVLVTETRRMELGFRSGGAGDSVPFPTEALMITGDLEIIDVQMTVQYNIKDLNDFLYKVDDPGDESRTIPAGRPDGRTLKDAAESALRQVVGQLSIDDVLVRNREYVETETRGELQEILDRYHTGINVLTVHLQNVRPPEEVRGAFDDISQAARDKDSMIAQAQEYEADAIPQAIIEAEKIVNEAEASALGKIIQAEEEARRFAAILEGYDQEKDMTRRSLYLESMEELLPGVTKFILSAEPDP